MKRKVTTARILAIFIAAALFFNNQQILFAVSASPQEREADGVSEDGGGEDTGESDVPAEGGSGGKDSGSSGGDTENDTTGTDDDTGEENGNSPDDNPGTGEEDNPEGGDGTEDDPGEGDGIGDEDDPGEGDGAGDEDDPGEGDGTGDEDDPEEGEGTGDGDDPGDGDNDNTDADGNGAGDGIGDGNGSGSDGNPGEDEENPGNDAEGGDDHKPEGEDCIHQWVTDAESQKLICSICGKEKTVEDGESDVPEEEVCEHEWVTDPQTQKSICSKCGKEKTVEDGESDVPEEEVCEHEWVTDPQTQKSICSKCGKEKTAEDEEACEHEWVMDPETQKYICSKCGKEKIDEEEEICEHHWIRDLETLLIVCEKCGEESAGEENECPQGGFHIYKANEEGTGYVCLLCGGEKEVLDELDVTLAMYIQVMGEAGLFAAGDADDPASSTLPKTLADLQGWGSKNLIVSSLGDLLVIQELSKQTDFDGYTIQISQRSIGQLADHDSTPTWDLRNTPVFEGIGNKDHPFKGKVVSVYQSGLNYILDRPFFNYLSTDAEVETMSIKGSINAPGSTPQGIVAGILVKGDRARVSLKNIVLDGNVSNSQGAAGMLFGRVEGGTDLNHPVELYYDSSEVVIGRNESATVSGFHAGGIAGEITGSTVFRISEELSVSNLKAESVNMSAGSINGAYTWDGTSAAGMYVGAMEDGVLAISGASYEVNVARAGGVGGANGGLAGMVIGTKVSTDSSVDDPVIISGSGVVGKVSGGVIGYYDHAADGALNLSHVTVDVVVDATGSDGYFAGGVLGRYYRNEEGSADTPYDVISYVQVRKELKAWNAVGGIVGFLHGSNLRIGESGPEKNIVVSGNITSNSGGQLTETNLNVRAIGGVAGWLVGRYVEVENADISASFSTNAFSAGGIAGAVGKVLPGFTGERDSLLKIKDVSVDSSFGAYANHCRGGIFGAVQPGTMAALDGTVSINMNSGQSFESDNGGIRMRIGHIAGVRNESLIYWEESAVYTRPSGKNWKDDIGNYGGIIRNGSWGEGDRLISYEDGKVNGNVTQSAGDWLIDTEADLIRLSIMLNTQGRFASDCFGGASKADLLGASYLITGNMNLADSGIYSLNRNDDKGLDGAETFTGKLKGTGSGNVAIDLGELETTQSNLALFPRVGGGAEISGFTLRRTIDGASKYAAGLAGRVYGDFTVDDIVTDVNIKSYFTNNSNFNDTTHFYGGLAGEVRAQDHTELAVNNVKIGGEMEIRIASDHTMAGGLAASYLQEGAGSSRIFVNGFELLKGFGLSSAGRKCSGMFTQINDDTQRTDRTILSMSNIVIHNGASLEFGENTDKPGGGWLGMVWNDVAPDEAGHCSIEGITIGDGGTAGDGPSLSAGGVFGGLVNTVTGRIQLKNININNGIFNNNGAKKAGLLFCDGIDALIEIDGYTIAGRTLGESGGNASGAVQLTGGGSMDEIAAYNIGRNLNGAGDYASGGIVNIIYDGFPADHKTYQNKVTKDTSDRTRYYYNLFGSSFAGEDTFLSDTEKLDGSAPVITNDRQMMIWHLSQYMNESIKRYLERYYTGGVSKLNTNTEFKGKIDLSRVSYYPTMVTGGSYSFKNHGEIVFHGKEIADGAGVMTPSDGGRQHYMMHAGLFLSNSGAVTVEGDTDFLTLSGSVANLGDDSGALFSRTISDTKNIYRIRLKDLYVADYRKETAPGQDGHAVGLMIGKVEERTGTEDGKEVVYPVRLDLSWIETRGYDSLAGRKAAAALIGTVGSEDSSDISVEFTNLRVDSRKEGMFQYAALIDTNYYLEDQENLPGENGRMRRIRYLFTEYAFHNDAGTDKKQSYFPFDGSNPYYGNNTDGTYTESYVTVGSELAEGVEYWDNKEGPEDESVYYLPYKNSFKWNTKNVSDAYLPYVHTQGHKGSKEIEVNPKNFAIDKGCGTYEDPYQIEDARQLLALARYLQNKNDYKYLGGWKIHAFESGRTGGQVCDGTVHTEDNLIKYPDNGTAALPPDFPTQEQLGRAYYMIVKDIDFSAMKNGTDRQIAEDFLGLGTENMPFRGVIIGKKQDDGSYPVITLPFRRCWTDSTANVNHGLIQYAKGAVVKDLEIRGAGTETGDMDAAGTRTGVVKVRRMAGGVMACVLGGDNIIDNVTVNLKVVPADKSVQAGAYAGNVEQGSLILRNLSEESAENFQAGSWDSAGNTFTAGSGDGYQYISGLIGKVEDGCVIYEDNFGSSTPYHKKILDHGEKEIAGIYRNDRLPICRHYDIIVAGHLQGKVEIDDTADGFTARVRDASQLQIVSMAVNSDAFSIYYKEGGYDQKAACRKAAYDNTGQGAATLTGTGSDFDAATKEDDGVYYYPYLYKKNITFTNSGGWPGTLKSVSGGYTSQLNGPFTETGGVVTDVTAVMDYELVNAEYDMSVYGRGFRGLGASYGMFESIMVKGAGEASGVPVDRLNDTFYSDFRANFHGNGAVIHMETDRSYDDGIHTAALFNDLLDTTAGRSYTMSGFTVTGSVSSVNKNASVVTDSGNDSYANRTAAVAGLVRGPWTFENITVKDMLIEAKGNAGGITAWIEPVSGQTYTFKECVIGENTRIDTYGGSVGGVAGVITQHDSNAAGVSDVAVNLEGCSVQGMAGQVILAVKGRTGDRADTFNNGNNNYVQMAAGRSGGLIGYVGRRHVTDDFSSRLAVWVNIRDHAGKETVIENAKITGAYSSGGVIGAYDSLGEYDAPSAGTGTQPASGVMMHKTTVSSCEVEGYRWNMNARDDYFDYGVGGLIGEMRGNNLAIEASRVIDTNVTASNSPGQPDRKTTGMYAGGGIGCLKTRTASVTDVEVQGGIDSMLKDRLELGGQQYQIRSGAADAGGLIGKTVCGSDPVPSKLTMGGIRILGMNIAVDDRTKAEEAGGIFKTSGGAAGCAGGVIGTSQMELEIRPDGSSTAADRGAEVRNCMIMASGRNVGGIIGAVGKLYNENKVRPTDIRNVTVKDCLIGWNNVTDFNAQGASNEYGAGGIYGSMPNVNCSINKDKENKNSHHLENASVSGCWIYGHNSGGMLGYAGRYTAIFSNTEGSDKYASVKLAGNKIYGVYAGGAIGRCRSHKVNYIGMKIEDSIVQAYRDFSTGTAMAGGFCGWADAGADDNEGYLDDISITGNKILAANAGGNKNVSVGGVFGNAGWSHCYAYRTELKNNLIGYSESPNGAALLKKNPAPGLNTLQMLFNSTDGELSANREVYLVTGDAGSLVTEPMPSAGELRDKTIGIGYYAGRIGNFMGTFSGSGEIYFLSPSVVFDDTFSGKTRPVTDVGMEAGTAGTDDTLLGSPYAYRKNVHIIYHDVEETADGDAGVWDGVSIDGAGGSWKNLFDGISYTNLIEAYTDAKDTSDVFEYLDACRLGVRADSQADITAQEVYGKLYRNEKGLLLSPVMTADGTYLPMIVLDTQYGTADQLMKGVVAALTNVGGVYAADDGTYSAGIGKVTNIETRPMKMTSDGKVEAQTGRASLEAREVSGKWTVEYKGFDNDGLDGNEQTFTLLTITYSWNYTPQGQTDQVERKEVLSIPVFVVERLTIDTHLKIMEGLVYNGDKVKKDGLCSSGIVIANDSSYTLYSEYIYGAAREKYPVGIEKSVGLSYEENNTTVEKGFVEGTKLTLIDICDNNKVYYYTVKKDDHGPYAYTLFVDDEGVPYKNKEINKDDGFELYGEDASDPPFNTTDMIDGKKEEFEYANVAVERFLITVDISGVKPEEIQGRELRDFSISPGLSEDLEKKTTLTNHTTLKAAIQPGMKIKFDNKNAVGEEEKTWMEGNIKADDDGFVNIWAVIDISADPLYWTAVLQNGGVNTIDSANNNKYLELQVYMTPNNSEQEVFLPSGTNVSIEGERSSPAGIKLENIPDTIDKQNLEPYYDESNIHFYKDGKLEFRMNDLREIISEEIRNNGYTEGVIRWCDKLTLDFRNADMSKHNLDEYTMHLKLLRIENKDYPTGGERIDEYERSIPAARKQDLACALETKDLMQLGINTYEGQTKMPHEIAFDFKLDFTGVLTNIEETDQKTAEKYYTVAYRIWEKTNERGTPLYEVYEGSQIELALENDPDGRKLAEAESSGGEKFQYVTYQFTLDEIKKGTRYPAGDQAGKKEEQKEGVIIRKLKLTLKDAGKMDLSNYKVQAIVYVTDEKPLPADLNLDSITTLTDFFVFTVAKLKTDLDY
ncbi:hypothetical protein IMSAG249_00209 [Lachnospiraceae bacterium]|nr:hypothetical protein IMSAG249_00209 [Lachnospiraceae bacterium]